MGVIAIDLHVVRAAEEMPFATKQMPSQLVNGVVVRGAQVPVWNAPGHTTNPPRTLSASPARTTASQSVPRAEAKKETARRATAQISVEAKDADRSQAPRPGPTGDELDAWNVALGVTKDATQIPPPPAPDNSFSVAAGQQLSAAMRAFLRKHDKRMQWSTRADFVIEHPYRVTREELNATLEEVLAAYGLSATIWEGNGVVEIYQTGAEREAR